jgi:hypothetical protein
LRIGTVKNSKNFFVASGPTLATIAGTVNDSALVTVKALSDIGGASLPELCDDGQNIIGHKRSYVG